MAVATDLASVASCAPSLEEQAGAGLWQIHADDVFILCSPLNCNLRRARIRAGPPNGMRRSNIAAGFSLSPDLAGQPRFAKILALADDMVTVGQVPLFCRSATAYAILKCAA